MGFRGAVLLDDFRREPDALKPVGRYETYPRSRGTYIACGPLLSARMTMTGIWLPAGAPLNTISFYSATTALVTGVNQWFALYDASRNLLRQTVDDGAAAWAASSEKPLGLTSQFVTTYTGLHYLGINVVATTVPTLLGQTGIANSTVMGAAPIIAGTSNTGLAGIAPNPANALVAQLGMLYATIY